MNENEYEEEEIREDDEEGRTRWKKSCPPCTKSMMKQRRSGVWNE